VWTDCQSRVVQGKGAITDFRGVHHGVDPAVDMIDHMMIVTIGVVTGQGTDTTSLGMNEMVAMTVVALQQEGHHQEEEVDLQTVDAEADQEVPDQ